MKKIKGMLSVIICAAMLSGCGKSPEAPAAVTTAPVSETAAVTTARSATVAAALAGEDDAAVVPVKEEKPLVIAAEGCDADYTPFVNVSEFDRIISRACFTRLLGRTRSGSTVLTGMTGMSELYGGRKYSYEGIADTAVTRDEEAGTAVYAFSLRSDVKFADGEILDADDVIFTLYAALDAGADCGLRDADIVGARNYLYNSPFAEELTDEEIAEALASEDIVPIIREKLIVPVLKEQYANVEALYTDNSHDIYTATYPDPLKLFVFFFAADRSYEIPEGADTDKVISDIADGYGADYRRLAGVAAGDGNAFDSRALELAIGYLSAQRSEEGAGGTVKSVTGITKTGRFSLAVTVRGSGRALEEALCELPIMPLHYYGDETRFDPAAGRFGFTRGKASEMAAGRAGDFMGSGAYALGGYDGDRVLLRANTNYYGGAPQTGSVTLIPASDPVAAISDGEADITFSACSAELTKKADEANRTLEKIGIGKVVSEGYGYAAFDVNVVNVAGEPFSERSCALRKAFAAAVRFYARDSVYDYFGDGAVAAELPCIGNYVPDTSAEDYISPYTVDVSGEPIFTEEMTKSEARSALKKACLGFLEKAGYTVDEDKVTEAPEGGKLVFNAEYSGGGTGSHPAKYALENAAKLLGELGITLNVTDMPDAGLYYEDITAGNTALGALSYSGTLRGKLAAPLSRELAGELGELADAVMNAPADEIQAAYSALYDKMIYEYAAEIPLYGQVTDVLYSSLRLDRSSFTRDMTAWYGQIDELHKIKMK
ncbi:MAG: hypothetical protein K5876_03680 [Ruminiclostridium sp.]|nr:hypothetical protein [Ruminiclostridium sp.]